MCITLHLIGLNFSNHFSDHCTNLSRSCCSETASSWLAILVQIFVSSANILILFLTQSGKFCTNIKNRSGPRNFRELSWECFVVLYKSLLRPHLEYANAVCAPRRMCDIEKIEKVQMRATKLIRGLSSRCYKERLHV